MDRPVGERAQPEPSVGPQSRQQGQAPESFGLRELDHLGWGFRTRATRSGLRGARRAFSRIAGCVAVCHCRLCRPRAGENILNLPPWAAGSALLKGAADRGLVAKEEAMLGSGQSSESSAALQRPAATLVETSGQSVRAQRPDVPLIFVSGAIRAGDRRSQQSGLARHEG